MADTLISSDQFDPELRKTLIALLDTMIPENEQFDAPSAGEEDIVQDVISSMTGDSREVVIALLEQINSDSAGAFHELSPSERREIFENLERQHNRNLRVLSSLLLQCYYRADKVLQSLGMDARPPYPVGHEVEEGDWSLLDPVKARGKIYRDV